MERVRINVRHLAASLLLSLVLPMGFVLGIDISLGWMPFLTIGAMIILIPLSTVIVTRATLAELDRVIQVVAPLDADQKD